MGISTTQVSLVKIHFTWNFDIFWPKFEAVVIHANIFIESDFELKWIQIRSVLSHYAGQFYILNINLKVLLFTTK